MQEKNRNSLTPWGWIVIGSIGLFFVVWVLQMLIQWLTVMAFLGEFSGAAAGSIFPLRKD